MQSLRKNLDVIAVEVTCESEHTAAIVVYSSPTIRTQQTCQYVVSHTCNVIQFACKKQQQEQNINNVNNKYKNTYQFASFLFVHA